MLARCHDLAEGILELFEADRHSDELVVKDINRPLFLHEQKELTPCILDVIFPTIIIIEI